MEILRRDPDACKAVASVVGKDLSEFENTPGITQHDVLNAVSVALKAQKEKQPND